MKDYSNFDTVGSHMPHNPKIEMHEGLVKKLVFGMFKEEHPEVKLSELTFYRLWKEEFSHVVIKNVTVIKLYHH